MRLDGWSWLSDESKMPSIYGSGEDFLTFHAMTHGLRDVLSQLGDHSDTAEAVVLFRPSFGRRGGISHFGEFDTIVGTGHCVYPIETKHADSSEIIGTVVTLNAQQRKRHQVFRAYLEEWRRSPPRDWPEFAARMRPRLQTYGLVPPGSCQGFRVVTYTCPAANGSRFVRI
jgi:hypothetical protein